MHSPHAKNGGGGLIQYKAKEVHFNGPSEHKIDGHRTDMEMQIIHEAEPGQIDPSDHDTPHHAVVSVLFKKEETHAIPELIVDITHDGHDVDFMKSLFSKHHNFYYYQGSHT